jgi:hypothetical protein
MQAVGAESGAVSWLECMASRGRVLRLCSPYFGTVGSKPNRCFRRLTCLRLVGAGLIVSAPPLEDLRPAPRTRSRTPSAPAVLGGFTALYRQLQPCARARTWCLNLVWRSARKWIHPANAYARKITKTTPSAGQAIQHQKTLEGREESIKSGRLGRSRLLAAK